MTIPISISELVEKLITHFEGEYSQESVLQLLTDYPVDPETLQPYHHFCENKYTRNLVHAHQKFEVMVLCWDRGVVSAIHNHCDQDCWMTAPEGQLLVQNYRVVDGDERGGHCRLEPASQLWMTPEHPAFVDPDMPIHTVSNPAELDQQTVSIHVYSYPYSTCMIYSTENDLAREVALSFDTEPGVKAPAVG